MAYGFTNAGGGGGSTGPLKKGTIVVSYPAGATCTVSNGSKTYTALDSSGAAAFSVDPGAWTVRAYGADGDTSESVSVAAGGWVSVELSFWNGILYDAGNMYEDITGGWVKVRGSVTINATNIRVTGGGSNADSIVSTQNKIDLKGFSALHISINEATSDGVSGDFQVYDADSAAEITYSDQVASMRANKQGEYELDISALAAGSNTLYFVGYKVAGTTGVNRYYGFDKVWIT